MHNLKNIYDNLQSRGKFTCPSFPSLNFEGYFANFEHTAEVHELESKAVKMAHKLNPTVIMPSSIDKVSVKLAVAVFNETTLQVEDHYASHYGCESFKGTSAFIIYYYTQNMEYNECAYGLH